MVQILKWQEKINLTHHQYITHLISCAKLNEFFSQEKLRTEFLNNKEIINLIIDQGNINTKDIVLEVGPGTGSLTKIF